MANPVMQFQILSKAPEETERFYSSLFGWNVGDANAMGYRAVDTGATDGIQGGIWPAPPHANTFVQLFIRVDDVKISTETARALGATVLIPATVLPGGDEIAILVDPTGMSFGLMRARS